MLWHLVLPVICLTYGGFAFLSKLARGATLGRADWVERFIKRPNDEAKRTRGFLGELDRAPSWINSPTQALVFALQIAATMSAIFLHR